jgi:hypothetical protein
MARSDDVEKKQEAKIETPKARTIIQAPNHTRNLILIVAGVVVVAAAFLTGMQVADNQRGPVGFGKFGPETMRVGGPGFRGRYGGGVNTQNGIVVSGKVTAVNGNDFTVDQNGSSKTVKTNGNTGFRGVGISGIKSGDQVVVSGTTNSDGSIQALSVSVATATNASVSSPTESGTTESF